MDHLHANALVGRSHSTPVSLVGCLIATAPSWIPDQWGQRLVLEVGRRPLHLHPPSCSCLSFATSYSHWVRPNRPRCKCITSIICQHFPCLVWWQYDSMYQWCSGPWCHAIHADLFPLACAWAHECLCGTMSSLASLSRVHWACMTQEITICIRVWSVYEDAWYLVNPSFSLCHINLYTR